MQKLTPQYYKIEKSKKPIYANDSKMRNYDLIYDENVKQIRTGFYKSQFRGYEPDNSDTLWAVEAGFEHRTDLISFKFYGTAKYDWVIEDVNNIEDPIKDVIQGKKLIIPDRTKVYTIR